MRFSHGCCCGLALLLLIGPSPLRAEPDEELIRRATALLLAERGRCERGEALAPEDLRLRAACRLDQQRYDDAYQAFSALDPALPGVARGLVISAYHQDDLGAARRWLQRSEGTDFYGTAEYHLYDGLIHLAEGGSGEAAIALERAAQIDPATVEPVASFYAALAWGSEGDAARMRAAANRVRAMAPETDWARRVGRLESATPHRWRGSLQARIEHADDVLLREPAWLQPDDVTGASEQSGGWGLDLGYAYAESVGVSIAYAGSAYFDASELDRQGLGLEVWGVPLRTGRTRVRLAADIRQDWVDGARLEHQQRLTALVRHEWGEPGASALTIRGFRYLAMDSEHDVPDGAGAVGGACLSATHAFCAPPGIDERRERDADGLGVTARLAHSIEVPVLDQLEAHYAFTAYDSRGRDFTFQSHELGLKQQRRLSGNLSLDTFGSFTHRPYRFATSFPDVAAPAPTVQYGLSTRNRRDQTWSAGAALTLGMGRRVSLRLVFDYLSNRSNLEPFDFDRERVSLVTSVRLNP